MLADLCFLRRNTMLIEYSVGDIIETKKPHPCGGKTWEILRTGADVKMKCVTCGRIVMLSREEAEKRTKKVLQKKNEE